MINEQIVSRIFEEVQGKFPDTQNLKGIVKEVCNHSITALSGYISEAEFPCPPGVWVLVSIDGVSPAGLLFNKDFNGVWRSWPGNVVKNYAHIKFYKYV